MKHEDTERPDVLTIMAEIRKRVKADAEGARDTRGAFVPGVANFDGSVTRKAGELLYSEELRYLNTNYAYSTQLDLSKIVSHRPGFIGNCIVKAKRKLLKIIWDSLLKDYLSAEREFQANTVRFLNDVSKYLDARDAQNFWELVRKIDYDVTKVLERVERIHDEQMGSLRSSERRTTDELNEAKRLLEQMKERLAQVQGEVATVDSVARGLEGIVAQLKGTRPKLPLAAEGAVAHQSEDDFSYLLLENRYRGSEAEISRRLEVYPPYFEGTKNPVLELGPGRGELQQHFKSHSIPSYGIDLDAAMVEVSVQKGFDCRLGDGIAHLRTVPDKSLGGIIAVQVVEHLTRSQLQELFTLAAKKVVAGGRIIFETINPRSVSALSSNYFRDPTHVWPLHPDTLSYALTLAGLKIHEVRMLSPIPEGALLQQIPTGEYLSPRWQDTVDILNRNLKQLNDLLYGYQDYCVVAEALE